MPKEMTDAMLPALNPKSLSQGASTPLVAALDPKVAGELIPEPPLPSYEADIPCRILVPVARRLSAWRRARFCERP